MRKPKLGSFKPTSAAEWMPHYDAKHFNSLGRRSNVQLNQNTNQENPLHINTITQDIKQHYSPNTIIKSKINSWPTIMLIDPEPAATITNAKLFKQVNTRLQLSSTGIKLVRQKRLLM